MLIDRIVVGQLEVNCYIISDAVTSEAMIVDPGDEFERIAEVLDPAGVKPKYIIFTHAHYDHVCAVGDLKRTYGASVVMHEDEAGTYETTRRLCISWGYEPEDFPGADLLVKDGDRITLGQLGFEVIHTPGHTPGGMCLYGEGSIFTGDTLFQGSVGRTDLPGGSMEKLHVSLQRILQLPGDTRVLSGHGDETTIRREAERNPFLTGFRVGPV